MPPTSPISFDAVGDAAASIEEHLGPIDVWVKNAITTVVDFFEDISASEYERATRVTHLAAVWRTNVALARTVPPDRRTIVQIGSALAHRGIPLQSPYSGAKHAIKGSFESLRCELRSPPREPGTSDNGPTAWAEHPRSSTVA